MDKTGSAPETERQINPTHPLGPSPSLFYTEHMTARLVTIKSYVNPHEAQLDRTLLEVEGILAFTQDQTMNYLSFGTVNVRLQVPQEFVEQARHILWGDDEATDWEPDPDTEASAPTAGPVTCPRCQSLGAVEVTTGKLPVLLTVLLLGLPLLFQKKRMRCRACGTLFN